MKKFFVLLVVALAAIGTNFAFHSGGVAECEGCHQMHGANNPTLLVGSDASSACLDCHASNDTAPNGYHIMTNPVPGPGLPPVEMTPGGDFAWLKKDYFPLVRGARITEWGASHGHNVVAADFGYVAEGLTAPFGTFDASKLGCESCHDPHGKARRFADNSVSDVGGPIVSSGSYHNSADPQLRGTANMAVGLYRLLWAPNTNYTNAASYGPVVNAGTDFGAIFKAVAPATYNRSEATTQTRVAYGAEAGSRVGLWCASCHPDAHSAIADFNHPSDDSLGGVIATNYRAYVSSGLLTNTDTTKGFLSLTNFGENGATFATLKSHANPASNWNYPPASTDEVMCLSCHRAHASGFPHMLRFDYGYEFMTGSDAGGLAVYWYEGGPNFPSGTLTAADGNKHRGKSNAEWTNAYYGRPATFVGPMNRVLCNKCHAKD